MARRPRVGSTDDRWDWLFWDLHTARDRHVAAFEADVAGFVATLEQLYAGHVSQIVGGLRRDSVLRRDLEGVADRLESYLRWLSWSTWNVARLGPPLHVDSGATATRLSLAAVAHAGLRLVDDGWDEHETYKGRRPTLLAAAKALRPDASPAAASVLSAFLGFWVYESAVSRIDAASPPFAADVRRLFDAVAVGVVAEWASPEVTRAVYERIVQRKSVAYSMILYKALLKDVAPDLAERVLALLAEMDALAQVVNDIQDRDDDRARGQPNVLVQDVYGRDDGRGLEETVLERAQELWKSTTALPEAVADALAAMYVDVDLQAARLRPV